MAVRQDVMAKIGSPWSIAAATDMNADGKGDLVWYNSITGKTQIWFMNGRQITNRETVVDESGNESGAASASQTVGVEGAPVPLSFALHAAIPNPFASAIVPLARWKTSQPTLRNEMLTNS